MNKVLNTIEKIDIFGVPICLLSNSNNQRYQSKVGGIITIVLSSVSLAYFLYVITLWINNQIAPSISSKQKTIGYAEFQLPESMIELNLEDFTGDVDPFKKVNNIITPLLVTFINTTVLEKPIPLFSNDQNPYRIELKNVNLVLNTLDSYDETKKLQEQHAIILARCSSQFLVEGSNCADSQTIDDYLSRFHGFLFVKIRLSQLDLVTKELELFKKLYYTSFDTNKPQYSQIMLKQQQSIIDNGILFNNYEHFNFLNNYELITQETDKKYLANTINAMSKFNYDFDSYGCYLFRIDNISIVEEITYPKLGFVLAQIGSIIQLIFMLKYIVLYYNDQLSENELLNEIITMYYPEFKQFSVNFINQFRFDEQDLNIKQLPIENMKLKYQALKKGAKEKCRLTNLLYEISRIQFILQDKFGDQILSQSRQMGGKLQNIQIELQSFKETNQLQIKPVDSIDMECYSIEPLEILIKQT
ncbi:unnamed protein product (macronuclear) [Paramecium tetraurelia]|uniref:Transmembrane protein n=1 Tax=Paramecium tetraurelia TaxID=5888 RepID=A0CQZ0_PARTE|nr:uncharacterized protein GSPATT00038863001 [Paramecium tetraurelia]CAK73207.1 unnamed protein product [Paramecium tetraurelia]|eukprot:XP_001440604.1 hypothetical protein (macronuclear) [Paramecium tetraurelia strain d4-2]